MFQSVTNHLRQALVGSFAALFCSASVLSGSAAAQTIVLNQSGSQVTDTTIRSGAYANTNFDGQPLITRRSSDPDWERRTLIKFDTENFVPAGAQIASATLTLTVKSGLGSSGAVRPLRALRVTTGFLEEDATWRVRMNSSTWSTPGGDVAEEIATANASNVAGAKVVMNLTAMVQRAVDGDFDNRYTRLLLHDEASGAKESYREYYSSEDSTVSRRPTLTIVLAAGSTPPPPTTSGTSSTIKVLQWNIQKGKGMDGQSNIDRVVDFIADQGADVISFNEIMHYSSSSQPQMIADKLRARTGKTWSWHWIQKWGASSGEGACVMTHLDIDAKDDYLLSYERAVAMARLNVNGRIVNVFSTHLDHEYSSRRVAQVKQLVAWADNHAEQRIIAGDFNGWPGTAEINEMLKTHNDGWLVAKSKGVAVSYSGNPDGNTRNTRIDYVWASKGASALTVTRAQVFYTKGSSGISDHNALIVTYKVQ